MLHARRLQASILSITVSMVLADAWSASQAASVDPTHLPVGTPYVSSTRYGRGLLYVCSAFNGMGPGAQVKGPWFNADGTTWDSTRKIAVRGAVNQKGTFSASQDEQRHLRGDGLPSTLTGKYPIATNDPAYQYDHNPNQVERAPIAWELPLAPAIAEAPSCLGMGAIGVLLNGARLYAPVDEAGRDAVAWEVQDRCDGHPQAQGTYHHHSVSSCVTRRYRDKPGQHAPLVGYIADGFGLYGNQGEGGRPLNNNDLDECHGHLHLVRVGGKDVEQYHYHQTMEFPYTVGCFKGKPVTLDAQAADPMPPDEQAPAPMPGLGG